MININEQNPQEQLRTLAVNLKADLVESFGISQLNLDNEFGKGYINSVEISPNLFSRTYNIRFYKDVIFRKEEGGAYPLYFLFAVKGHYYHQFADSEVQQKIGELQNVILTSAEGKGHIITLPKDIDLQLSVIFLYQDKFQKNIQNNRSNLWRAVNDTFEYINLKDRYEYFGELDYRTLEFAKLLVENNRTDVIGRFVTEGAVLNTIASQLQGYNKEVKNGNNTSDIRGVLSLEELNRIVKVAAYISENIEDRVKIKDLAREASVGLSKLQKGIQHLFGLSANALIVSIKLEHAKELLLTTDKTISEIVYSIGFTSRSYFSKKFKEMYGLVPTDYRKAAFKSGSLYELSYRSKADANITDGQISDIVQTSREKNKALNITGCLVHYNSSFFQLLEGPKDAILKLYDTIVTDDRHHDVKLLWKGLITKRSFENWDLAMVNEDGLAKIVKNDNIIKINLNDFTKDDSNDTFHSNIMWKRISDIVKISA